MAEQDVLLHEVRLQNRPFFWILEVQHRHRIILHAQLRHALEIPLGQMIVGEAEQEERGGQFFLQSQQIPLQLVVMHSRHRNERITLLVGERGGEAVLVAAVHDDQTVERVAAPRQNLLIARSTHHTGNQPKQLLILFVGVCLEQTETGTHENAFFKRPVSIVNRSHSLQLIRNGFKGAQIQIQQL